MYIVFEVEQYYKANNPKLQALPPTPRFPSLTHDCQFFWPFLLPFPFIFLNNLIILLFLDLPPFKYSPLSMEKSVLIATYSHTSLPILPMS